MVASLLGPAGAVRAAGCPGERTQPTTRTLARAVSATVCLLNAERRAHGLRPLRSDPLLASAASTYAGRMVSGHFFAHVSPAGSTLLGRLSATRYLPGRGAWTAGENIAWGEGTLATPTAIVNAWMHSAPHRQNILTTAFRDVGVGIAQGEPGSDRLSAATYTTDFGARVALKVAGALVQTPSPELVTNIRPERGNQPPSLRCSL